MIALFSKDQLDTYNGYSTKAPIGFLDHAKKCIVTEERNGMYELSMEYPFDGPAYYAIEEQCIISAGPYIDAENDFFRIYNITLDMQGNKVISASHISYDLSKLPFIPYRIQENGTTITSKICTATKLSDAISLFNEAIIMAMNDDSPPFKMETDFEKEESMTVTSASSIRSLIGGDNSMLDIYGGELMYDKLNIYLLESRGSDNGVVIEYGKNLTDLQYEQNSSDTYNCIYPFILVDDTISEGFSEFDVDEPEEEEDSDKNNGLYHWDIFRFMKYLQKKGVSFPNTYDEYLDDYLYIHPKDVVVTNRRAYMLDCSDAIKEKLEKDELVPDSSFANYALQLINEMVLGAIEEMTEDIFDPKITTNISFEMLSQYPEFKGIEFVENVNLCDLVTLRVPKLGIETKAKCIKTEYDVLANKYDNISISTDWEDSTSNGVSDTIAQLSTQKNQNEEPKQETSPATEFTALNPLISYGRKDGSVVGDHSIAVGKDVEASGIYAQAFGMNSISSGVRSSSEGNGTTASGENSHAEGETTKALGRDSHAEGLNSQAVGTRSHAEGDYCRALNDNDHAEGSASLANGGSSHAENNSTAGGVYSHSEGTSKVFGRYCHGEGYDTQMQASDEGSHVEGYKTKITQTTNRGYGNHAEGYETTITNCVGAHAEGFKSRCLANANYSHAEGQDTFTIGAGSHAEGIGTGVQSEAGHVQGKYNVRDNSGNYADIIGGGTSAGYANIETVDWSGNAWYAGNITSTGADYAEYVAPWFDNNPNNEDRVGYFVTVKNGKLYKANRGEYVIGITSGAPSIVGNADGEYMKRWERDEFGRILKDEQGNRIQSETYDQNLQNGYIRRKDRPEWDYVGMLGVISVRDNGTCVPGRFCIPNLDGIATNYSGIQTGHSYYVLERISGNVIKVLFR